MKGGFAVGLLINFAGNVIISWNSPTPLAWHLGFGMIIGLFGGVIFGASLHE